MSYGVAEALQTAVYQQLAGHAPLVALVGSAIYDAPPPGPLPPLYVSLGPETVRDRSDGSARGAMHEFTVSVITESAGFSDAKAAAAAVSDALLSGDLTLSRGALVALNFHRAKAARTGSGDLRRIDLSFRARVEDDA